MLLTGIRLTKNAFFINLILQFAFLSLYYVIPISLIQHIVGSNDELFLMSYGTYHLVIAITLLLCTFFIDKINKMQNIYRCSIAIMTTLILLLLFPKEPLGLLLIFTEGAFFAIGQLLSFTYFWRLTVAEERGRIAGFIGFLVIPLSHLVGQLAQSIEMFDIIMLGVFLNIGILTIKVLKPEESTLLKNKKTKAYPYHEKRTVFLYFIPWMIFSLINLTLGRNISINVFQSIPSSLYIFLLILQMTAAGFGALSGGIIADFLGRRVSLGFSLTLYGFSTALGGFAQNLEVFYFMYIINGLTWGILWVMFGSVVWGDLANDEHCAKRYSIGVICYYFSVWFGIFLSNQISLIPLFVSSLIGCSMIFLSNIPLLLAPEILPSDFRDRIKLKLHMNVIKKLLRK